MKTEDQLRDELYSLDEQLGVREKQLMIPKADSRLSPARRKKLDNERRELQEKRDAVWYEFRRLYRPHLI